MSEHNGTVSCELVPGLGVSVPSKVSPELPAQVVTNSPDETWLRLTRPQPLTPFNRDERVRIKYWDEEAVVYYWEAEVINIPSSGKRHLAISVQDKGITV